MWFRGMSACSWSSVPTTRANVAEVWIRSVRAECAERGVLISEGGMYRLQ